MMAASITNCSPMGLHGAIMKTISVCIAMVLAAPFALAQELPPDAEMPARPALTPAAEPDPEASAEKVRQALRETSGVPAAEISVGTHAGTILLTGEADSEAERVAANAAAQKAAAGTRVSNNIEVRPLAERSPQAQQIAEQKSQVVQDVEAALLADTRTANLGVAVTSEDGKVVVLQGLVPTRESRTAAQTLASQVKGVSRVDNRLQLPGG
jgi:osmotically-inducible protein OsmY